jgi:Kef-type K+ transport system membrane component KefB
MGNVELAIQFFLQLAIILVCCRLVGGVARRLGQPQVVGEMVTGILLGPSLFGLYWPEIQQAIFPWDPSQQSRDTQSYLFPVSQLGLALYMFIVGLEFRIDIIRDNLKASLAVSIAGMIAPFLLGAALAVLLFYATDLFPEKTSLLEATLFLGASMCITAFPMLARIIHHKRLGGTRMGTVSLGAGAINDAAAWCILALVLASIQNDYSLALFSVLGGIGYVAVVLLVIRPLLGWSHEWLMLRDTPLKKGSDPSEAERASPLFQRTLSEAGLVLCLALMCLGAWFTEMAGLHAVLGAFVMGTAMPRGIVTRELIGRIQPLTVAILLPLFFAFSGLNTRLSLIDSAFLWAMCGLVLVAAVVGKGVACWLAARWAGLDQRESLGVGTLMNVRGLMELIIINIGLERGIISEGLFATLVIMAVVTTLMASPIFDWLVGPMPAQPQDASAEELSEGLA